MRCFAAVGELGSLSAASRKLKIPIPSVSRKLAKLEAHLGIGLVTRSTRRCMLTEAGQQYLSSCRRILAEVDEADRAAAGQTGAPRGLLLATAPVVFGRLHVLPIVTEFLAAFPEVSLEFSLLDRIVQLIDEGLDVAVRIGHLADSSLLARRVGAIRLVTCAAPEYLAKNGVPSKPADIASDQCVVFSQVTGSDRWEFRPKGLDPISVPIRPRLTVTTAEAAIDAAIAGLGFVRVMSYQAHEAIRQGRLVRILRDFEPPELPVNIVYAESRFVPSRMRAFIDYLAPRLAKRLRNELQGETAVLGS